MSQYEIFSSDPALLTYFAKHLQEPSCTIIKEEDRYELCSSDIDALESSASLGQGTDGLLSVLHLLSPNFKTIRTDEKVRVGVKGLLFMLNGVIKLKYKMPGLTRELTISPSQVKIGIVSMRDDQSRTVKSTSRDITMRVNITVGEDFLLAADTRPPTAVEIWRLARANAPIANALYYYANANLDDRANLNNVVEQIRVTFRKGQFDKWAHKWIGQNKQEADSKIKALEQWLNNPYISGSKARHSPEEPHRIKADKLRATNSTIDSEEATKIIDTLLTKWIEENHATLVKRFLDEPTTIHLLIVEEPLTPQNLATVLTVLTELTTKFWLIAKRRFIDLIEYTQTHDIRFAHEAGTVITKVSYNSPLNFFLKFDMSAPSVAEAFVTTLDGIKQRDVRQQKAELENISKELENQAKTQQIEEARQKAEHKQHMAELDRKVKELEFQQRQVEVMFELEQKRADLLERTLEMLNKNRINAGEIAANAVHILLPDGDTTTKLMLSQSLLPGILQLQDVKGLELVSPEPPQADEYNPKEDTGQ